MSFHRMVPELGVEVAQQRMRGERRHSANELVDRRHRISPPTLVRLGSHERLAPTHPRGAWPTRSQALDELSALDQELGWMGYGP
jgi:hypothetical protein